MDTKVKDRAAEQCMSIFLNIQPGNSHNSRILFFFKLENTQKPSADTSTKIYAKGK